MIKILDRSLLVFNGRWFWFILALAFYPIHAQNFVVRDFSADIYLHEDGYFDVVEVYNVEFLIKHLTVLRLRRFILKFESEGPVKFDHL